jgi:hypothetical protein
MDLFNLEHCGFDYEEFKKELFLNGIDDRAAEFPIMLCVNFEGGCAINPETINPNNMKQMVESDKKFQELMKRLNGENNDIVK